VEESPVPGGGQRQLVVGQPGRPSGAQDPHRQVLVDHDHRSAARSGAVVGVLGAAEKWVRCADGLERCLELASQVPVDETAKKLAVRRGETRVAGATATATLLDQFFTDAHANQFAPMRSPARVRRSAGFFFNCSAVKGRQSETPRG